MKDTEIINFYNNLDQYAKDKIDRQLIDLTNAKKESRNYCIKVCPKCGAVDPGFTKGGNANSGKPMLKCSAVINALLMTMVSLHTIPTRTNQSGTSLS